MRTCCGRNLAVWPQPTESSPRQGAALEPWERDYTDALVSPKIKAGQSAHHICATDSAKLTRHERNHELVREILPKCNRGRLNAP